MCRPLLPVACKVLEQSALETLVVARLADMLPWAKRLGLSLFGRGQTMRAPDVPGIMPWRSLLIDAQPPSVPLDAERDLALIQYTGGTTGTPKGAMLSHQNLTANARQVDAVDPFREGRDMIMGVLPLFHVFANTCVLNRTVAKGGCVALMPRFEAGAGARNDGACESEFVSRGADNVSGLAGQQAAWTDRFFVTARSAFPAARRCPARCTSVSNRQAGRGWSRDMA